jgi:hypothetical protein
MSDEEDKKKKRKRLGEDVKSSAAGLVEFTNPDTGATVTIHRGDMSHKEFLDVVQEASQGKLKNDISDREMGRSGDTGAAPPVSKLKENDSPDESIRSRTEGRASVERAKAKEAQPKSMADRLENAIGSLTDRIDKLITPGNPKVHRSDGSTRELTPDERVQLETNKSRTEPTLGADADQPQMPPEKIELKPFEEGGGGRGGLQGIAELVKGATPPGLTWDAENNKPQVPVDSVQNRQIVADDPRFAQNPDGSLREATQRERDDRNMNKFPASFGVAGAGGTSGGAQGAGEGGDTPLPPFGAKTPKSAFVPADPKEGLPAGYTPPPVSATPAAPDPLLAGNEKAAMGIAMPRTVGGYKSAQDNPEFLKKFADSTEQAAQAQLGASKTIGAAQDQQQDNFVKAQAYSNEQMKQMLSQAQLAAEARQRGVDSAARMNSAAQNTWAKVREESARGVDPARYWNNQSDGQKAAAIISAALFGFAGKGMEALQRLDALVERDMRMQVSDRESRVAGLTAQAKSQETARDFALTQGATEAEAHLIQKGAIIEAMKSNLDMLAASSSNAQVKMNAANLSAGLASSAATNWQGLVNVNHQANVQKDLVAYHNAELQNQRAHMELQARLAAMKAGEKEKLTGKPLEEVQSDRKSIEAVNALIKNASEHKSLWERVKGKTLGGLSAEERGAVQDYELGVAGLERGIAGGVLRKFDQQAIGQYIPRRNQLADPLPGLKRLRRDMLKAHRSNLEGLHLNKSDVSGFVPELKAWEAEDSETPSYATPK